MSRKRKLHEAEETDTSEQTTNKLDEVNIASLESMGFTRDRIVTVVESLNVSDVEDLFNSTLTLLLASPIKNSTPPPNPNPNLNLNSPSEPNQPNDVTMPDAPSSTTLSPPPNDIRVSKVAPKSETIPDIQINSKSEHDKGDDSDTDSDSGFEPINDNKRPLKRRRKQKRVSIDTIDSDATTDDDDMANASDSTQRLPSNDVDTSDSDSDSDLEVVANGSKPLNKRRRAPPNRRRRNNIGQPLHKRSRLNNSSAAAATTSTSTSSISTSSTSTTSSAVNHTSTSSAAVNHTSASSDVPASNTAHADTLSSKAEVSSLASDPSESDQKASSTTDDQPMMRRNSSFFHTDDLAATHEKLAVEMDVDTRLAMMAEELRKADAKFEQRREDCERRMFGNDVTKEALTSVSGQINNILEEQPTLDLTDDTISRDTLVKALQWVTIAMKTLRRIPKDYTDELDHKNWEYREELSHKEAKVRQLRQQYEDEKYAKELMDKDNRCGGRITLADHTRGLIFNNPRLAKYRTTDILECTICYLDDVPKSEFMFFEECCHGYCQSCLQYTLKAKIEDQNVRDVQCPFDGCEHILTHEEIRLILDREMFEKYETNLLDNTLQIDKDCKFCPAPDCGCAMFADPDSTEPRLTCPKCKTRFCFRCKTADPHEGVSCEAFQQWKKENDAADAKFEEWTKTNTKPCPKCESLIEKNGGCNHMTCKKCKHEFHWTTLEDWKGYNAAYAGNAPVYANAGRGRGAARARGGRAPRARGRGRRARRR